MTTYICNNKNIIVLLFKLLYLFIGIVEQYVVYNDCISKCYTLIAMHNNMVII